MLKNYRYLTSHKLVSACSLSTKEAIKKEYEDPTNELRRNIATKNFFVLIKFFIRL